MIIDDKTRYWYDKDYYGEIKSNDQRLMLRKLLCKERTQRKQKLLDKLTDLGWDYQCLTRFMQ